MEKTAGMKEEFIKILKSINPLMQLNDVFSDWLKITAAFLYFWKKNKSVNEEYIEIMKKYSKEEQSKFADLLAITAIELGKGKYDFLGEVFISAKLHRNKKTQILTPYPVSEMLSKMALGEIEFNKDEIYFINDPCCGSGRLLITAAKYLETYNFDKSKNALYIGIDIDERFAEMTFIQLSLLGLPAIVIWGNSLTKETFWQKETLDYHLSGMNDTLSDLERTAKRKK